MSYLDAPCVTEANPVTAARPKTTRSFNAGRTADKDTQVAENDTVWRWNNVLIKSNNRLKLLTGSGVGTLIYRRSAP
jgi:hypothetical protein